MSVASNQRGHSDQLTNLKSPVREPKVTEIEKQRERETEKHRERGREGNRETATLGTTH